MGIKDIADRAGVSVSTVSNVLNGKKNVGEDTRELILEICNDMGYRSAALKKLRTRQENNVILFIFSEPDRQFFLKVLKGIRDYIYDKGYDILLCTNKTCEQYMSSERTKGCIILDVEVKNSILKKAANKNYPIIVLDRVIREPYIKSVVVNNYTPMCDMVQRLVDNDYRRFSFIGGTEESEDTQERFLAFKETLDKNGILFDMNHYFAGDYREKSGYTAGKMIALNEKLPQALICANDNMAVGAMKAFKEKGIKVPEDISVTGFDNIAAAEILGLTTITLPYYERGYLAAQFLMNNIKGKETYDLFHISAQVIWRKTAQYEKLKSKI